MVAEVPITPMRPERVARQAASAAALTTPVKGTSNPAVISSVIMEEMVPQAATIIPPLTTVRFPVEEIVRHTVELLVTKLNRRPLTPGRMTPEMPLVIRDSVADRTQETHNRQYVK